MRASRFFVNRVKDLRCGAVVSHISRKTSEMWATHRSVMGGKILGFGFFGFDGDLDVRGYFAMQLNGHMKLT